MHREKRSIVAGAVDEHALEAAFLAQEKGYVTPVLVGDKDGILTLIKKLGFENAPYEIVHCDGGHQSVFRCGPVDPRRAAATLF